MNGIPDLLNCHFLASTGLGPADACIAWAITRLQNDEEGDDQDVVLLASTNDLNEALERSKRILSKYADPSTLNPEYIAGKCIANLHPRYIHQDISINQLDQIFGTLYSKLDYPNWLVMLSRNCEYATDVPNFVEPFEQEFQYIADLWNRSSSLNEFLQTYDRKTSNSHDLSQA